MHPKKTIFSIKFFDGQINERIEENQGFYLQYGNRDANRSLSILKDHRSSTRDEVLTRVSESPLYLGQVL